MSWVLVLVSDGKPGACSSCSPLRVSLRAGVPVPQVMKETFAVPVRVSAGFGRSNVGDSRG